MTDEKPTKDKRPRADAPEARVALRLVLGFFGGLFVAVATYIAVRGVIAEQQEQFAEIAAMLGLLLGAPVIAFAAFSQNVALRIAAWSIAGAGLGNALLAFAAGGVIAGDFFTPGGMVMAVVGVVLGYRTVPSGSDSSDPLQSDAGRKSPLRRAGVWIAILVFSLCALTIVFLERARRLQPAVNVNSPVSAPETPAESN